MTALIPTNFGQISTVFAGQKVENEFGAGVSGGFAHIGYKGKVWSVRRGGEETKIMRPDGDGAANSIEIVVLKASGVVSKIFYEGQFVEGSHAAPDCFSTNGVTPDASAAKPQATACANCKHNAWGSRITPAGKKGKACSDSKRLAVVPLNDLQNEAYGGPMLLRVPAASLQELAQFGQKMGALGFPSYSYGVRVAFDVSEAYPKFVFSAIRPLTDGEAKLVMTMRESDAVSRILAEDGGIVEAGPSKQAQIASAFEQPPQAALPAPTPVAAPAPVTPQVTKPTLVVNNEEQAPTGAQSFDDALDSKLGELLPE